MRQVKFAEELDRFLSCAVIAHQPVSYGRLANLVIEPLGRIEGGSRALRHIGDAPTAQLAELLGA